MRPGKRNASGWQGIGLVAITYVYFLIFAQFAFLRRLADLGVAGDRLRGVMAAMAAGGIGLSLLAPRLRLWPSPVLRLRIGLAASAAAAGLCLLPMGPRAGMAVAGLIGAGLGLLTVTLVTHLRSWIGQAHPLFSVGLGTGLGYLICNVPPLFAAGPRIQALVAGAFCLAGIGVAGVRAAPPEADTRVPQAPPAGPFPHLLACFSALVWLDSAAFLIIQHTPALKAGTWEGPAHLWANGALHLAGALAAVPLIRRKGLGTALAAAFLALGSACLLLDAHRAPLASVLYPIGVSLYSVALVAYPALLAPAAAAAGRGRRAGWLYAVAGWSGSAMGIGMAQNLGRVPPAFVILAGAVVLAPRLLPALLPRKRELAVMASLLLGALLLEPLLDPAGTRPALSPMERGRRVYVAEGCINCHSQYVRPGTADESLWGPVVPLAERRRDQPPLIGNRRQGPDLSQVGARRSSAWLRAHFLDPSGVSGGSSMPPYGYLFEDRRGEDLVAYLASLHGADLRGKREQERHWQPSPASLAAADAGEGRRVFLRLCATCHFPGGRARLRAGFRKLPPDLSLGPYYLDGAPAEPAPERLVRLARIIKFGIPGTDMPGHEALSDQAVASTSLWLSRNLAQPVSTPPHPIPERRTP